MPRHKHLLNLVQLAKTQQEYKEVTHFLAKNDLFKSLVHKTEFIKQKFWYKIDEAAFPEKYQEALLNSGEQPDLPKKQ